MQRNWKRALAAAALALALAAPLAAQGKLERKVSAARDVYLELLDTPDRAVPRNLLESCACIAVIPNVIKGAFWWGGRHGKGVLTCRGQEGGWSPPIFVKLSGGSFGFQIGAQSTDLVLFFMTERSVRSLLRSRFTLGGDASVAAGPAGRSAEAGTDLHLKAEIYSYARSRGLFAGLSVEGARLAPHQRSIDAFYGGRHWPDDLLFKGEGPALPAAARAFVQVLP